MILTPATWQAFLASTSRKMVRKLTLMRHGEAETGMGYRKDFDRNLTMEGVNKLQRLNKVLQQRRTRFDFLITSPAVRAVQTSHWITYTLAVDDKSVDRKSTRLNSSHVRISYAVFCLKKKKKTKRY